jgi:predicted RNase H-like nuclease (RuvC/YqgF family)
MALITTRRLDWFTDTMHQAAEHLPKVIGDVRETVEHREHLIRELEGRDRVIEALNVKIAELKDQANFLNERLQEEYRKTARAEHLISTTVKQLADSNAFHDAAQGLLTDGRGPANG